MLDLLVTRYGYGHHIDTIHDERNIEMFLKVSIDSATYIDPAIDPSNRLAGLRLRTGICRCHLCDQGFLLPFLPQDLPWQIL
jgi:hypothetical protein